MNRGLLVVDKINNNPLESTKTEVPFTSAQEKIKTIEDEVSIELNRDWDEKNKEIQEKEQIEKNIKEFYEKLLCKIRIWYLNYYLCINMFYISKFALMIAKCSTNI